MFIWVFSPLVAGRTDLLFHREDGHLSSVSRCNAFKQTVMWFCCNPRSAQPLGHIAFMCYGNYGKYQKPTWKMDMNTPFMWYFPLGN